MEILQAIDITTIFNRAFFIKEILTEKDLLPNGVLSDEKNELFFILMKYVGTVNYQDHLRTLHNFFKKYKVLMKSEQEETILEEVWDQMLHESSKLCKNVTTKEEEDFLFYTLDFLIRAWQHIK